MRRLALLLLGLGFPAVCSAQRFLNITNGVTWTVTSISIRLAYVMAIFISSLCVVLFMIGALMVVASRGKDDMIQRGKDMMYGALIGTALVLGAAMIARMFIALVYA